MLQMSVELLAECLHHWKIYAVHNTFHVEKHNHHHLYFQAWYSRLFQSDVILKCPQLITRGTTDSESPVLQFIQGHCKFCLFVNFKWVIPVVLHTIINRENKVKHNFKVLLLRCFYYSHSNILGTTICFTLSLGHHQVDCLFLMRQLYNMQYQVFCF